MATKARMTVDDLWRLGEGDVRRELVDGEVIEMTPVGGVHGQVTGRIYRRLAEHVEQHGGGEVVVGDVGFVLGLPADPDRVRRPTSPSSPSDNPIQTHQKVCDYLDAGARLVWVVVPQARTATVYRADGSARLLREQDALEGEDVLPGLRILLGEVFG